MGDRQRGFFSDWIFKSFQVSPRGFALYRIFYGLFLLFFLVPSLKIFSFISSLPADFFTPPPGPMALFHGFPSHEAFLFLFGALILSTCGLIAGFYTKLSSILTGLLLLLINGFIFSVGKINHELLMMVIPILMAFSGWGTVYSVDAARSQKAEAEIQPWTLVLLALFIGFMFFTAGFSKILGGWLRTDSQAAVGHFYKQFYVVGRQEFLADSAIQISNALFWECMDYLTVLFETTFLLAIFHARSTRIYICFAVLFHFSLMMILNISFLPNFVAYAAFLNWDGIDQFLRSRYSQSGGRWRIPLIFLGMLSAIFTAILLLDNGKLLQGDWGLPGVVIVTASVPVALYYLFMQVKRCF